MSVLRVLLVVTVLTNCLAQEDAQPAAPADLSNAVDAFKADLWKLITIDQFQWAVAAFGIVFGYVALTDGKKFFQGLVLVCVAAVTFTFVLSQLNDTWTGPQAKMLKYVVALEAGLFMGYAAKRGWECTQLLLGLALGMFIFHNAQALAVKIPQVHDLTEHSVWITALATLAVLLGCWMVHENHGAGRVMGIVTPLFGSSTVVAAIGYLAMLAASGNVNTPSKIPSVIEFWNMTVFPMSSQAVGIFVAQGTFLTMGEHKFAIDQLLSVFFWIVIFLFSVKYQLKADSEERQNAKVTLKAPLLAPKQAEAEVDAKLP